MNPVIVLLEDLYNMLGGKVWPSNPPPVALPPRFIPLQRVLEAVLSDDPSFSSLGIVILNFGPVDNLYKSPACAYVRETDPAQVGSAGKLAILYAAFQLKQDVQSVLDAFAATSRAAPPNMADLQAGLKHYWASLKALKDVAAPNLAQIFDDPSKSGGGWTVEFKGIAACGYEANWTFDAARTQSVEKLCKVHNNEYLYDDAKKRGKNKEVAAWQKWQSAINPLTFAEKLWLTSRWSDNLAATEAAIDLTASPGYTSLKYIQALLQESGLGDARHGFWISELYQSPAPPYRHDLRVLWPGGGQRSDAQSLARLLIGVATGQLISGEIAQEIMSLVRHLDPVVQSTRSIDGQNVNWAGSFTLNGIKPIFSDYTIGRCASKLGIYGSLSADWTILTASMGAHPSKYLFGVTAVNGTYSDDDSNISSFANTFFTELMAPENKDALGQP